MTSIDQAKPASIVELDIVGFTSQYKKADDQVEILRIFQNMLATVGRSFLRCGDFLKKYHFQDTGDGGYLILDDFSASEALQFVWEFSELLEQYNQKDNCDYPLQLRCVLAYGEVKWVGKMLYGSALADAERLISDKNFKNYQAATRSNIALFLTNLYNLKLKEALSGDSRFPHLQTLDWSRCEVKDKHKQVHIGYILGKDIKIDPASKSPRSHRDTRKKVGAPSALAAALTLSEEISAYMDKAKSLHEKLPLVGFKTALRVPIRIEDIYVPLNAMFDMRVTGKACFADAKDAEKCLRDDGACREISIPEAFRVTERLARRGLVILGDPGSGKTTHMKRLLLWCLNKEHEQLGLPEDMLPVFLPLRELKDLKSGLGAFIEQQLDQPHMGVNAGFGEQLLKRGKLLFLFDGLDEVAEAEHRKQVSGWIGAALKAYPDCRFVVTSRFAGYTPEARLDEEFLEMHIRPLTGEQANTFIHNWYRIVETGQSTDPVQAALLARKGSDDLIERLAQPEFRARRVFEMTRNPLLLTNLCLVHRDRGNLPHNRNRLYEECTDVLLELWRGDIGGSTKMTAQTGRRVLQPAALWLHQEDERTRATAEELAPVIEPALKAVGWTDGTAHDFLKAVRDKSGLLTGWDHEHYGFMHLGFQEYLAARELRRRAFAEPAILRDLAKHFGESWWQEVTLLLLALEDPSLFVSFMREVVKLPNFVAHSELVEMCLDDAAETAVTPFIELLETEAGEDQGLWEKQLSALRIAESIDVKALQTLVSRLKEHPYDQIRKRIIDRFAVGGSFLAGRGSYELVLVPGGTFMMGSSESEAGHYEDESPIHEVRVPDFYMGRYPVTNEEYGLFLKDNPKIAEPTYWGDRQYNQPRQPVVGVSWHEAKQYAEWAGLRLPSESEWEFACRAGTQTRYYIGDTKEDLSRAGWYLGNSGMVLHSVGEKEPNSFGLYDMHGNVYEWIEDDWHNNYVGAPADGRAWVYTPRTNGRALRGGSWYFDARYCRCAGRGRVDLGNCGDGIGFRCARTR